MAIIDSGHYIMCDVTDNHNKFWNIELHDDGTVITKWGRVGLKDQSKTFPGGGRSFYDSKIREKTNKGYTLQRTLQGANSPKQQVVSTSNLASVATKQIQTNNPEANKLIEYLARVNRHQILASTSIQYNESTGLFQTPLGIVTSDAISDARSLLNKMADYVVKNDYDNPVFVRSVNQYMMYIPQNIGMKRFDARVAYPDVVSLQKQNNILDSLAASLQTVMTTPVTDNKEQKEEEKIFDVKLHLVEDGTIIDNIRKKYKSTLNSGHSCSHLDVKKVYEVEIGSMSKAYQEGVKVGNVHQLWHGTRVNNLLSILKGGLVVPPASSPHVCGRLFGDGLYYAPSSTKSLNYSYGYWDGKGKDDNCFMFLASVAMGRFYVPTYGERLPKAGYDSTWAKKGTSGVQNDECIVYKAKQSNLDYLIEFSPSGR